MLKQAVLGQIDNRPVHAYTVTNAHGVEMTVLDYGATWDRLAIPTAHGLQNLLLNVDVATYAGEKAYFGKALGRFSGRIGQDQLIISGEPWPLIPNEDGTTLHGGPHGFSNLWWDAEAADDHVTFKRVIPSDLDGFPGDLTATVTYTLTEADEVVIDFTGASTADTVFNPMNHAYWNLNAEDETIENHVLQLRSSKRYALADNKVPTGEVLDNSDTPYDFTSGVPVGEAVAKLQDIPEQGFDDIFAIDEHSADEPVATLQAGGIKVDFYSNRNALVLFTSNHFDDSFHFVDKTSRPYIGIVLEPETTPLAAVAPAFGDVWLRPGEVRHEQARYAVKW